MFTKLSSIFKALHSGSSLIKSETWKNRQVAMNAIAVVLGAVVVFVPGLGLSQADIEILAGAIAIIGGVLNGYFTVATTDKIGIPGSSGSAELHSDTTVTDTDVQPDNSLDGGSNLLS